MSMEKSEIMSEFLKIADSENLLGLQKEALPAENPYQEDIDTIKEKRLDKSDKHIMELAHPEPVYIAESQGDGALVENPIEQQRKTVEIVNKHPTGSLVGRYAYAVNSLVKMANAADDVGAHDAAAVLTDTAKELVQQMSHNIDNMHDMADDIGAELQALLSEGEENPFVGAPEDE